MTEFQGEIEMLVVGGKDTGGQAPMRLPVVRYEGDELLIPVTTFNWYAGRRESLTPVIKKLPSVEIICDTPDMLSPEQRNWLFRADPGVGKAKFFTLKSLATVMDTPAEAKQLRKALILDQVQWVTLRAECERMLESPLVIQVEVELDQDQDQDQDQDVAIVYGNARTEWFGLKEQQRTIERSLGHTKRALKRAWSDVDRAELALRMAKRKAQEVDLEYYKYEDANTQIQYQLGVWADTLNILYPLVK